MILINESNIAIPDKGTIAIFRREVDGLVFYKDNSGRIENIPEEAGVYVLSTLKGKLSFTNYINYTGEDIREIKKNLQEFFFKLTAEKVIERRRSSSRNTNSGITRTIVVTSESITMGSAVLTDYVYFVAGAHTMSLPSPNTNLYVVKNNHSANITINTVSGEIEDAASISISPESSVDILSDGTNWFVT